MKPYFSIIVPLFNQETKLEKCIESLKGQTYRDFEVLIIDDGSTDGSVALVQKLTEGDSRFRIIRHEKNHEKNSVSGIFRAFHSQALLKNASSSSMASRLPENMNPWPCPGRTESSA